MRPNRRRSLGGRDQIMMTTVSHLEEFISRLCHTPAAHSALARTGDPAEFWKRFAQKAIRGGYFKSADEFVRFVEACTRYLGSEQVVQDRGSVLGIRSLSEAIARQWARGPASENAPTSDEIAGLLQSAWVTSGEFRSLRSADAGRAADQRGR
jgi:hypothetical protein